MIQNMVFQCLLGWYVQPFKQVSPVKMHSPLPLRVYVTKFCTLGWEGYLSVNLVNGLIVGLGPFSGLCIHKM